jgi:dsRNA-specific ribonuclease
VGDDARRRALVLGLVEAITCGTCGEGELHFQRLETVGDAFLKWAVSAHLFLMDPQANEVNKT